MLQRSGLAGHLFEKPPWRPPSKRKPPTTVALLVLTVFLMAALVTYSLWIGTSGVLIKNSRDKTSSVVVSKKPKVPIQRIEIPLNCTNDGSTKIYVPGKPRGSRGTWWKERTEQPRFISKYPGGLPDLEIMFDTEDRPAIKSRDYIGPNATSPPPLFRYCGDKETLDIVFPDWSFWGWAEINIKPWDSILKDIKEGNRKIKWIDREPYAYWKGNPFVDENRQDLLKCNVTDQQDWNARLFIQDWILEGQQGFKQSNVADQCTYRYKIYIEGYAWSVSEKYILACDSVTFMVQPRFYDFFMRSMQPVEHYWPIRDDDKCRSLKFAVDWGNNHKKKAHEIGKAASSFMQEQLKMDYVYDYMYHLLNEYAKLLKFEPRIPEGATELCSEVMACHAEGQQGRKKKFMMESLVKGPSITNPCTLPPPYDRLALAAFLRRKDNSILQVKKWEEGYWESLNKQ
ncbi:hypothetical protein GQ457_17G022450 [Hibiscus cannabinus]